MFKTLSKHRISTEHFSNEGQLLLNLIILTIKCTRLFEHVHVWKMREKNENRVFHKSSKPSNLNRAFLKRKTVASKPDYLYNKVYAAFRTRTRVKNSTKNENRSSKNFQNAIEPSSLNRTFFKRNTVPSKRDYLSDKVFSSFSIASTRKNTARKTRIEFFKNVQKLSNQRVWRKANISMTEAGNSLSSDTRLRMGGQPHCVHTRIQWSSNMSAARTNIKRRVRSWDEM